MPPLRRTPRHHHRSSGSTSTSARLRVLEQALTNLSNVVARQTEATMQAPPIPPPVPPLVRDPDESALECFRRLDPPTFNGRLTTEDPQEFFRQIEKTIRVIHCSDERAVELAGFQLGGQAGLWYTEFLQGRNDSGSPSWEEFKNAFMRRFLSESRRAQMVEEFLRLRLVSGMSVAEYDERFTYLAQAASSMMPTETDRVRRFVQGLPKDMFLSLQPHIGVMDYAQVVDTAIGLESGLAERRAAHDAGKRAKTHGSFSFGTGGSRGVHQQGQQRGQSGRATFSEPTPARPAVSQTQSRGGSQFSGQGSVKTYPLCQTCGKHHLGQCMMGSYACYGCGQQGHKRIDCPFRQGSSSQGSVNPATPAQSFQSTARGGSMASANRGPGGRGSGGRGTGGRGQGSGGQPRLFAMTQQDAQASTQCLQV